MLDKEDRATHQIAAYCPPLPITRMERVSVRTQLRWWIAGLYLRLLAWAWED
jgi:hypothetical protein